MGNAESSSSELNPTSSRWLNESSSSNGRRSESKKSTEEEEDGESRSVSSSLMAGAAVAGTALLALGAWKLATSSTDAPSNRCSYRSESTRTVKFMTYNVWIQDKVKLENRMEAIGRLIKKHSPDVIMFQEVTQNKIEIFNNSEWLMGYKYKLPRSPPENSGCFCIMMSKMQMEAESIELVALDESKLCVASMGRSLLLATCHLKSPLAPKILSKDMRRKQADELLSKLAQWRNVVLGGDMNWNEDGTADWPSPWVDAWTVLRPGKDGNTYDTVQNEMIANNNIVQKRLDRFVCKLQDFKLEDIEIIGTEAIDDQKASYRNKEVPLFPSDHFGLVLTISAK